MKQEAKVIEVRPLFEEDRKTIICIVFNIRIDAGGGCVEPLRIIKTIPCTEYDRYKQLVGQYVLLDITVHQVTGTPHQKLKSDSINNI